MTTHERIAPNPTVAWVELVLGLSSLLGGLTLIFMRRGLQKVEEPGVPKGRQFGQDAGARPAPQGRPEQHGAPNGTAQGAPNGASQGARSGAAKAPTWQEARMAKQNARYEQIRGFFMQFSPRTRGVMILVAGFIGFYTGVLGPLDSLSRHPGSTVYISTRVSGSMIIAMEYGLFVLLTGIEITELKKGKYKQLAFIVFLILCVATSWHFQSWLHTEVAKLGMELR